MKSPRLAHQAGFALILMLLGLMSIGGIVLAGFTQQAKQDLELQRVEHNEAVLKQAKLDTFLLYRPAAGNVV